jgi:outer membrane receptor protein involved in Fe transport
VRIDGQDTVDLNLRFEGGPRGLLKDTQLVLTVRNLFDQDPPFYDNPTGFGFDPATGDPIGRFVALQLIRNW